MGKAIIAFILSVGVGTWLSFFNHGIGVVGQYAAQVT